MRQLERQFAEELVVVGVHAGKYPAERLTANIRQAVLRLEVEHPVVNDRAFRTWREYAISAWPTLVLVDPHGRVVAQHPGEIRAEEYAPAITAVIEEFDSRGGLSRAPLPRRLEAAAEPPRPLRFPGKVLVEGERLFIADSGHHRVVVVALGGDGSSGAVEIIAGRGVPGFADGAAAESAFRHPLGLALDGGTLYIADSGNHAIRALDLARGEVTTVAGTGQHAQGFRPAESPREVPLNSPWDLAVDGRQLYIAMAGAHQLWRLDLGRAGAGTSSIAPFAGNGAEAIVDGPRLRAALAQPSGVTLGGGDLYFADTESNAVRAAGLGGEGEVHTLVGTGLFDFGDRDGVGDEARLQHPQGIARHEGVLYVADTYNNKLKTVDPRSRRAETWSGFSFYEPGGLTVGGGRLYVADTNNHAIRVVDLATGEVATMALEGLA